MTTPRRNASGTWMRIPAPSPVLASEPDAPRWSRLTRTSSASRQSGGSWRRHVDDESHAAGIVLEGGVVRTARRGQRAERQGSLGQLSPGLATFPRFRSSQARRWSWRSRHAAGGESDSRPPPAPGCGSTAARRYRQRSRCHSRPDPGRVCRTVSPRSDPMCNVKCTIVTHFTICGGGNVLRSPQATPQTLSPAARPSRYALSADGLWYRSAPGFTTVSSVDWTPRTPPGPRSPVLGRPPSVLRCLS